MKTSLDRHNAEIHRNFEAWGKKTLLRELYRDFHAMIAEAVPSHLSGHVVELGSGVPDLREAIPGCIRTDIFANPWIDRVENAYALSFAAESISALILFDVFHHLRYPGEALREFQRVLLPGGRAIIFDPCLSLLGLVVYGLFHEEALGLNQTIRWDAPKDWSAANLDYYAAQGNATRVFLKKEIDLSGSGWQIAHIRRLSAISYLLSGGYSKPQLYPDCLFPFLRYVDRWGDRFPRLFATRLLVVLQKDLNA